MPTAILMLSVICSSSPATRDPAFSRTAEHGLLSKGHIKGAIRTAGGTIEELPSGAFTFKGWEKRSPVQGRIQRDSRK